MLAVQERVAAPERIEDSWDIQKSWFADISPMHQKDKVKDLEVEKPPARSRVRRTPPEAAQKLAPRLVNLVAREGTNKLYLRAFVQGHYFWQPVTRTADPIVDCGVWLTGSDLYRAYWRNLGSYRRRAGHYHPIDKVDTAAPAA